MMILVIGEVLIDQFPDYQRIGGAPLNFAYHLHHLGEAVRLVTRVGDDADGRRIRNYLEKCGLPTDDIQIDRRHATGRVKVSLTPDGMPTFKILAPAAYDFIDMAPLLSGASLPSIDLIYFGSLIQRTDQGFKQLRRLLQARSPSSRCFCDINLRAPHYGHEAVAHCLQQSDILKLNDEELAVIGRMVGCGPSPPQIVSRLMDNYGISTLALTHGANGSTIFHENERYESPKPAPTVVRDTVGAGDAFAAFLAAGMLHRRPMPVVLNAATAFSAHICGQQGALPDDSGIYDSYSQRMGV